MKRIYGVITTEGTLIDTSFTEKGAKNYASKHGYDRVGYRIKYNVTETHRKVGKKWIEYVEYNEEDILDLITYEMVKSLGYGDSVYLDPFERWEVYHYCEDDFICLRDNINEDFEEIYCIMVDDQEKAVIFEGL